MRAKVTHLLAVFIIGYHRVPIARPALVALSKRAGPDPSYAATSAWMSALAVPSPLCSCP